MKKILFTNTLIECILLILFVLIIVAAVIISVNTNRTNNKIDLINSSFKESPSLLLNNTNVNAISNLDSIKTDSNSYFFLVKVDSALFTIHNVKVKTSKEKIANLSRNVLDNNTISYLFQMISLLLLGIGIYLLKKVSEYSKESDKLSKNLSNLIQQLRFSNELIRAGEIMNFYSQFLVVDKKPYNSSNLLYCGKIALNNDKMKKILSQKKIEEISETDKTTIEDLLNNLLRQFESLQLIEIEGYYYKVYVEIIDNLAIINDLKSMPARLDL